jgi:hypothetical protein
MMCCTVSVSIPQNLQIGSGVVSQYSSHYLGTWCTSITTADAHTSAASSRLNWHPLRFKGIPPFGRKTKSGFCACAITFQLTSTTALAPAEKYALYLHDGCVGEDAAKARRTALNRCSATKPLWSWNMRVSWRWHRERALTATKQLLALEIFFLSVQNGIHRDSMCMCFLLRIRKVRRKKRHWVHPVFSKILLNGQFYKLCEHLRNCWGILFVYSSMRIESFHKLHVIVGPRITYENTRLHLSVPPQERLAVTLR